MTAARASHDGRIVAGVAALCAIALLIGGAFVGLIAEGAGDWSGAFSAFDAYMGRIVRFTLFQAILSTILSVVPAIFVARAFSRHASFPGRGWILRLFAVPLGIPAIVAALGILALYGRAGFVADLAARIGLGQWPGVYGLSGILVAHTFFNLPLATRLLLEALANVPADQWRLGSQLGMGARASFRLIEWPVIRSALPGVTGLVFMLCVTSFTLVLILGGGPRATTIEVAIYQALRFDFDPARAVSLTFLQIALTAIVIAILVRLGADLSSESNPPVSQRNWIASGPLERTVNAVLILISAIFVAAPFAAIVISGVEADLPRLAVEPSVQRATATSLALALISAVLCLLLSISLVAARRALADRRGGNTHAALESLVDAGASFVLVIPPIVIGAGWFILLRHTGNVFAAAPLMVVAVNAVMAMPFAVRAIRPAYDSSGERHDMLCAQLGIGGLARIRLIDWPVLRRPLATGFAFAMALSLGDLGVIALFGSDTVQTLPYLLLQRMGSYRTADAAGIALILGIVCLGLMMAADRLGRSPR